MTVKRKIQLLIAILMLAPIGLQGCRLSKDAQAESAPVRPTSGEIPTWTPRPKDLTARPTATKTAAATTAHTATPAPTKTPKRVTFNVAGGNLNVRRGPSLAYNYVGVLNDGDVAFALGRDRISRWLMIELPSKPGIKGWVTTETKYSSVDGDVSSLPFVQTEPATAAYIRNCTKHKVWILPADVYLLSKYDQPYNEERFDVGVHRVYDLEDPSGGVLQEISLTEGKSVDISHDWAGERSKCE